MALYLFIINLAWFDIVQSNASIHSVWLKCVNTFWGYCTCVALFWDLIYMLLYNIMASQIQSQFELSLHTCRKYTKPSNSKSFGNGFDV